MSVRWLQLRQFHLQLAGSFFFMKVGDKKHLNDVPLSPSGDRSQNRHCTSNPAA
jgi:hypothetical protein